MNFDDPIEPQGAGQTPKRPRNTKPNGEFSFGENEHGEPITPLDKITGNGTRTKSNATPKSNRAGGGESPADDGPSGPDDAQGDDVASAPVPDGQAEWAGDWSADPVEPSSEVAKVDIGLRAFFAAGRKQHFLTDKLIAEYCAALRTCIFIEIAAAQCDINVNSLKEWLRQGRRVYDYLWHEVMTHSDNTLEGAKALDESIAALTETDWINYKFYTEVQKAKADGEKEDLDFIARARAKDWKAAAWRLKIRDRKTYGDGPMTANQINIQQNSETNNFTVVDYSEFVNDENQESIEVGPDDFDELEDERTQ